MGAVLQQVHQGMCDDLNTPIALAALSAPLKAMNDLLSTKKGKKDQGAATHSGPVSASLAGDLPVTGDASHRSAKAVGPDAAAGSIQVCMLNMLLLVCMCTFHVLCGTRVMFCSKYRCISPAMMDSLGGVT